MNQHFVVTQASSLSLCLNFKYFVINDDQLLVQTDFYANLRKILEYEIKNIYCHLKNKKITRNITIKNDQNIFFNDHNPSKKKIEVSI